MTTALLERPASREAGEVVTGAIVPPASRNKPVLAVLATDQRQTDGLALDMAGCDLRRYRRNNVLIVGHNVRSLAVGSVEDIRVADIVIDNDGDIHVDAPMSRAGKRVRGLVGRLDFDRDTAAGREAEASVRSGKTRGVSIGFDIDKSSRDWRTGRVGKWWPTETSLVAVPLDEFARVYSRGYRPSYSYGRHIVDRHVALALLDAFVVRSNDAGRAEAEARQQRMRISARCGCQIYTDGEVASRCFSHVRRHTRGWTSGLSTRDLIRYVTRATQRAWY